MKLKDYSLEELISAKNKNTRKLERALRDEDADPVAIEKYEEFSLLLTREIKKKTCGFSR
jgi:hypothetical protein